MTDTVELAGEEFRVAERVGSMPLMRFAKLAKSGVRESQMEGLVAMYDLLHDCIDESDWDRFMDHATEVRADGKELLGVVRQAIAAVAGRPTRRSSDSSDGPRTIEPSSTGDSSSPVIHRLNEQGRPDLALLVRRRQESLSA